MRGRHTGGEARGAGKEGTTKKTVGASSRVLRSTAGATSRADSLPDRSIHSHTLILSHTHNHTTAPPPAAPPPRSLPRPPPRRPTPPLASPWPSRATPSPPSKTSKPSRRCCPTGELGFRRGACVSVGHRTQTHPSSHPTLSTASPSSSSTASSTSFPNSTPSDTRTSPPTTTSSRGTSPTAKSCRASSKSKPWPSWAASS